MFLDGVGIGPADATKNPFLIAELPNLRVIMGGIPTLESPAPRTQAGACFPLDANLGVLGHPQSGTGQVSLFTGLNGAKIFGRHFGPWTPVKLRALLADQNVMVKAERSGRTTTFANAYPVGYPEGVSTRRLAAPPLAALSVGALTRHHGELRDGKAVASGIDNDGWRQGLGHLDVPEVSDRRAGQNLAAIAEATDLTVYSHYDTDHVGHEGTLEDCARALEKVDRFIGGVLGGIEDETMLMIASDHGNIEEITASHTRNPVMGLAYRRAGLAQVSPRLAQNGATGSIMDVAPLILEVLGTNQA